jgi:hypothetical protein
MIKEKRSSFSYSTQGSIIGQSSATLSREEIAALGADIGKFDWGA